jgi:ABC-2 type transport system permease protein
MPSRRPVAHGLQTWAALWRVRALHELHYRANLLLNVGQVFVDLAIGVVAIRLVFSNVDEINGWDEPELLVVLGTYTILDAVIRALVLPGMWMLMQDIQEGTFDAVLLMPADEQLIVTARELSIWDLSGVVIGGCVTAYGSSRVDGLGPSDVLAYLAMLPVAVSIVYGFFLAVTSLAFRLVNLRDLLFRLFQGASYSGRWPLGIYPSWLRIALTVIVPIGLAVTIPSSALVGRLSWAGLGASVSTGAAVLVWSRWVFRRGTRAYSGASA